MPKPSPLTAIVIFPLVFLSSCATILNGPSQLIRVSTEKNISDLRVENTLSMESRTLDTAMIHAFIVPRSAQPLIIHFRLDTAEKTVRLQPRNSFAWWYNIFSNYGIGMLIDWHNPKRYSYPSWTYLAANDTVVYHHRFPPIPKGNLRLSLSYSPVDIFNILSPEGQYSTGGIFGAEAGLDYFHKPDRYISLAVGAATSVAPVEHLGSGYLRTGNALYANIRYNYVIGSFDLGYGGSISKLIWARTTFGDTVNLNKHTQSIGFGPSLSAQYRIGNSFRLGLLYQPTLMSVDHSPAFNYQHYISVNLCWKIRLRRSRLPGTTPGQCE